MRRENLVPSAVYRLLMRKCALLGQHIEQVAEVTNLYLELKT